MCSRYSICINWKYFANLGLKGVRFSLSSLVYSFWCSLIHASKMASMFASSPMSSEYTTDSICSFPNNDLKLSPLGRPAPYQHTTPMKPNTSKQTHRISIMTRYSRRLTHRGQTQTNKMTPPPPITIQYNLRMISFLNFLPKPNIMFFLHLLYCILVIVNAIPLLTLK